MRAVSAPRIVGARSPPRGRAARLDGPTDPAADATVSRETVRWRDPRAQGAPRATAVGARPAAPTLHLPTRSGGPIATRTVSRETVPRHLARSSSASCPRVSSSRLRRRWPRFSNCSRTRRRRHPCTIPRVGVDVHIADSLSGLEVPALRSARLIADLGAGGGLPGLVLAAVLPDARVVLVESLKRKCAFIRDAAAAMGLDERRRRVRARGGVAGRRGRVRRRHRTGAGRAAGRVRVRRAAAARRRRAWSRGRARSTEAEAADGAAAATLLGLEEEPPLGGASVRRIRAPDAPGRAQDRAHAAQLPAPARDCNETAALCEKPALKARQYRVSRRDPPSAPLASETE